VRLSIVTASYAPATTAARIALSTDRRAASLRGGTPEQALRLHGSAPSARATSLRRSTAVRRRPIPVRHRPGPNSRRSTSSTRTRSRRPSSSLGPCPATTGYTTRVRRSVPDQPTPAEESRLPRSAPAPTAPSIPETPAPAPLTSSAFQSTAVSVFETTCFGARRWPRRTESPMSSVQKRISSVSGATPARDGRRPSSVRLIECRIGLMRRSPSMQTVVSPDGLTVLPSRPPVTAPAPRAPTPAASSEWSSPPTAPARARSHRAARSTSPTRHLPSPPASQRPRTAAASPHP
jgi:hypothetical protein